MAIQDVSVIQASGTPVVNVAGDRLVGRMGYQIVNLTDGAVLATGQLVEHTSDVSLEGAEFVRSRLLGRVRKLRELHRVLQWAEPDLGGHSLLEALTWLQDWQAQPLTTSGWWRLTHPFEESQVYDVNLAESGGLDANDWPTIPGLLAALVARCLPGPAGLQAEEAGSDHVLSCQAVAGAAGYRWYVDGVSAGDTSGLNHLVTLGTGTHEVHVAAKAGDDTIGLVSAAVQVVVE